MLSSPFGRSLKKSLLPSITIFACTIVMVLCGRLAFALLESGGGMSYIYATSGSGTTLEQLCEIFTGTSIVALVAIGGIIGGMIAALFASAGWRFARGLAGDDEAALGDGVRGADSGSGSDAGSGGAAARGALIPQFIVFALWMLVATLFVVAVFALVFLGSLSDVQFASVSSKLGGGAPGSSLMLPLTLVMLWTLLLMGGALVFAAVSAAGGGRRGPFATAIFLVVAALLVGVLLVFLSVALFTRFNVIGIDYTSLNTWIGISIAANLVVTVLGLGLSRFFIGRK